MSSPLILALDLGTSSTRAAIFDAQGNRLPNTTIQHSYPLLTSADGAAELEPGVLLGATRKCIEGAMQRYRVDVTLRGRPIAGIGVSCFWHSLVGIDSRGTAITRILTWADSRCREDAAKLRERHTEKKIHALTGCMLRASFWPAKLAWLRREDPKLFDRVRQWMSPAEWLQLTLTGDACCALGMATGTGLFNPSRLAWEPQMLKLCHIDGENLRPLGDTATPIHGELAEQFHELRGVPWFPAIGDGAASNLGSGATRPGLAAINVGTSAAIRIMREGREARAPFGLFCYRVDEKRYLVGGAISNAGNLRAWCLRELRLPDETAIERHLAERPGPAPGLDVLPFWSAERAPSWNEDATGMIHGITQSTTALDLLHAITEASYQRLACIAALLLENQRKLPRIIVSGGIQRSPQAIQRLCDVLDLPIHPNDEMEASIRGAAIYVIEKLGLPAPSPRFSAAMKPRARHARAYAEQRERLRRYEGFEW